MNQIRVQVIGKKIIIDVDASPIAEAEFKQLTTDDVMLFLLGHITTGLSETRKNEAEIASVVS
jgi:hypothetical protein